MHITMIVKRAMYIYDGSGNEIKKVMDPAERQNDKFGRQVYTSSKSIGV